MTALRLAVIGGGHLGRIHARLASADGPYKVVGVVDPGEAARELVAEQLKLPTYADYRELIGQVDAAIVAAPTANHYEVTSTLLRAGVHCLVEKPLATSADQAERLVQIAKNHSRVLQVGHVERFNPCWTAVESKLRTPKFIEAERSGPYSGRSTDIGVVMDLMVHDLDLILSLDSSPVENIAASGLALLGSHEDIAEARIEFASGLIANVKASRVATAPKRQMQVYAPGGHATIDFSASEVAFTRPDVNVLARNIALDEMPASERMAAKEKISTEFLTTEQIEAPKRNAILDEQNDFAISIQTNVSPVVSGEAGARAVKVANQILGTIASHRWDGSSSKPWRVGPLATTAPRIIPMPGRDSHPPAASPPKRRAG